MPKYPVLNRLYAILRGLNTLFAWHVMLTVGLLVVTQIAWTQIVGTQHADREADHLGDVLQSVLGPDLLSSTARERFAAALNIQLVAAGEPPPAQCPDACVPTTGPFESRLLQRLPAGSLVAVNPPQARAWIRYGAGGPWAIVPVDATTPHRLLAATVAMLLSAIAISLWGAWQLQRPVVRLAKAARQLRGGSRPATLTVSGPTEIKELVADFNEMTREICDADEERAIMLAGVAHDLRAPLARVQLRAAMIEQPETRAGLLQDTASLAQIIGQFLEFAQFQNTEPSEQTPEWQSVDRHCMERYGEDTAGTDAASPLKLDLTAGAGFRLPVLDLDRMLSNLIENGFAYGLPPLLISTYVHAGRYVLSVRDHGRGIDPADLQRVQRPFVRLDAARGGDAHCGLGLAIVRRLCRRRGGELLLSNARDGGLVAAMSFPMSATIHPSPNAPSART